MAHKPTRLESLKSADGGGTFEDMEHRVAFLEKSFGKMDGKLDVILNGIAGLKEDVSILKGRRFRPEGGRIGSEGRRFRLEGRRFRLERGCRLSERQD